MTERVQFCVALEDRPGMLATLCRHLRRADVNIEALFATQDERCTWVYLVASPETDTRRALASGGYRFLTEQVLTVYMDNKPGTLEAIADALSAAGVNINYVYGSGPGGTPFTLVLSTSDSERAAHALASADRLRKPEVPGTTLRDQNTRETAGRSSVTR